MATSSERLLAGGIDHADASTRAVRIPIGRQALSGDLILPRDARGLVAFAHGSGSSRRSPRNRRVARLLNDEGLATLLCDLLTEDEERIDVQTAELRFDIGLLARRMGEIITWTRATDAVSSLPLGLFGASTGAAAALTAAASDPDAVDAVVSRGGRPDLAGRMLERVQAPTLLIVGSRDRQVIELNRRAARQLRCEHRLEIVPGASHLFEQPGTLDQAARLAASWFVEHFAADAPAPAGSARSRSARRERGDDGATTGPYADREAAGTVLARAVRAHADRFVEPIVVALPRGGVPVAVPVAEALGAPLHVTVARKVGAPQQPELALGAVDEDGVALIDDELVHALRISSGEVRELVAAAHAQARRRAGALRDGRPVPAFTGHDVILVDDGYATGMTARAAAHYLTRHGARHVTLAVPVAPRDALEHPAEEFDRIICPYAPRPFRAVGLHYATFDQVPDATVRTLLEQFASTDAAKRSIR